MSGCFGEIGNLVAVFYEKVALTGTIMKAYVKEIRGRRPEKAIFEEKHRFVLWNVRVFWRDREFVGGFLQKSSPGRPGRPDYEGIR